jgi:hypothetical protein
MLSRKSPMAVSLLLLVTAGLAVAGDDASGPIPYKTDLGQSFTVYAMSESDNAWSASLVDRLKYTGTVVHFVRTSLPLQVSGKTVKGAIYQAIEKPDYFYVVNGDAMLQLDTKWAYSPGVGGFSMHAPQSRNFIVCLNLSGGVPFLSSSPVRKGEVSWKGHDWNRFKCCTPAS